MIVVMAVAGNAPPHMANTHPALSYEIPQDVPNTGNLIKLYHAVPTRYVKGRGGQPAPFGLHCFTEDRWGAPPMRYHYNQDIGQTVTMVRFNPQGTGLLAARGWHHLRDGVRQDWPRTPACSWTWKTSGSSLRPSATTAIT